MSPIVIDGQSPRHQMSEPSAPITFRQILTGVAVNELPMAVWLEEAKRQGRAWCKTVPGGLWE